MPTITLNQKVFEQLVGKKLPLDKLKDRISMLGTDLESIEHGKITVEIFPNRPDMLSEQGFARAFSSFIGVKTCLRKYNIKPSGEKVIVDKNIKNIRPYTVCAIVKNLKLDDEKIREIIQIQEKLHATFCRNRKKAAIGIYPFENIKTPIRFMAMDPKEIRFIPLESKKTMNGLQILSQHPKGRDYAYLLEGLKQFPIFIDANNEILSMPPIINSNKTGKITEKTKEVFIEFSGFDLEYQKIGLNILAATFIDMGADVYSMEVVYPDKKIITPDLTPRKIKINKEYINKLLGLNLNEMKKYAERMGYGFESNYVLVPAYRADVLHQIDIAEDIAIAYGYENFKEEIPNIMTIGTPYKFENFKEKIANILIGLGLIEVNTYHITSKENQTNKMNCNIDIIQLANSVSPENNAVRYWIIPSLLEVLSNNKHNEYPQNIFDMGVVFNKDEKQETNVREATRLAIALCHEKAGYTEIKQILDYLMRILNIKYKIVDVEHNSFIPGRVGRVIVNDKKIAYIGEIAPNVLENWQLEMPVSCFELNLTELFKILS